MPGVGPVVSAVRLAQAIKGYTDPRSIVNTINYSMHVSNKMDRFAARQILRHTHIVPSVSLTQVRNVNSLPSELSLTLSPQPVPVVDLADALMMPTAILRDKRTPDIERAIFRVFHGAPAAAAPVVGSGPVVCSGPAVDTAGGDAGPVTAVYVNNPAPDDIQVAVPVAAGPVQPVKDLW